MRHREGGVKDRSLDEFVGGDAATESDGADETSGPAAEADDAAPGGEATTTGDDAGATPAESDSRGDAADPAVATSRWDPGGAACPDCGETVERRWRSDEEDPAAAFVCAECKDW
jgi:hypothetical protein